MSAHAIAIVGIGGVFPGSTNLDAFWQNVRAARDLSRVVPPGRWALDPDDAHAEGGPHPDRVTSVRGCFVEDVPDRFGELESLASDDPRLGLADRLRTLDPMNRLAVFAAQQAFDDAETDGLDRSRVGVVLGNIALPTAHASRWATATVGATLARRVLGRDDPAIPQVDPLDRYVAGLPALLAAEALGLGGGAHALDAACASSLYAVQFAMEELAAGRADAMLAGGLSRPDCLYTQMGFSQLRALSPTGRCAPFDARGNGLVVGEGAGVFVLKRLADAVADGDHVYAVLRGAGLSNDVQGSLLAPSTEGQLRAMRAAYAQAGWSPSDVDLVECHATGTPVGDAVEFASLSALWDGEPALDRRCVIGSVKSNVGHLLTGAGAAGLMKVLLALKSGELPPSANFASAGERVPIDDSPFEVLSAARPWERRAPDTPRRAAVSAFGFGGINAHLLLEEWRPETPVAVSRETNPDEGVAIVGIGAWYGPWRGRDAVVARLLGGGTDAAPAPGRTGWGSEDRVGSERAFRVGEIAVPRGRFRIPPTELADMLPQQLLLLEAAREALVDAGLCAAERSVRAPEPLLRTGVFVGMGLDLETTNFHLRWWLLPAARRWAKQLGRPDSGPEFDAWVAGLRDAFGPPLTANRVIGSLGGIVASRVAREFRIGGPSFALSSEETSGLQTLRIALRSVERGEIETALVGAVDLAAEFRTALGARRAERLRAAIGEGAGAVVLKSLAAARRDGDTVYAVVRGAAAADTANSARATARGDVALDGPGALDDGPVTPFLGDCGAAAGLASVIRAAAALHHGLRPADAPGDAPRAWLRNRVEGPRRALVTDTSVTGPSVAVLLEQAPDDVATPATGTSPLQRPEPALLVVEGADDDAVVAGLRELVNSARTAASTGTTLARFARERWTAGHGRSSDAPRAAAIVARSFDDLAERVERALRALAADGDPRAVNGRVALARDPLGPEGELAFVYPGSGNHFHGMGRALSARWPDVLREQDGRTGRLAGQLVPERFWEEDGADGLDDDHPSLIFGQVALGAFVTDVVRRFDVRPDSAIGYSLGETASLFSLGAWTDRDEMDRRLRASTLFTRDLCGPCDAARQVWGLPDDEPVDWVLGVVDRPADVVRDAIADEPRVDLLIVNTPEQCVIGGQRAAMRRVLAAVDAAFVELKGVTTVHCGLVEPVRQEYHDLHLFPVTAPADVRWYSCAWAEPYEPGTESCARSILDQATDGIDFPAVIERAHADGVRLFLELGPGGSCTRMIRRILGDRPHAAVSVCLPERDEVETLLVALARLIAERVPVDLAPLYDTAPRSLPDLPADAVRIRSGRPSFDPPAPPAVPAPVAPTPAVTSAPPPPAPVTSAPASPLARQIAATSTATAAAHEVFLRLSADLTRTMAANAALQATLGGGTATAAPPAVAAPPVAPTGPKPLFDRDQCMEIATGLLANVLGPDFVEVDAHPTRVRLPDEPLMLVDRIMTIEGEHRSLGSGRIVTEHDVKPGAWYLDHGRIPTCIAVESGQADLFLSGYLGIDFETKGLAVYRLLDAVVTFHAPLPGPGAVIRYDIRIDHFFRQGDAWLFRFHFEGSVDGKPLLTMTEGCAGFFTHERLAGGKGIVQRPLDVRPMPGKRPDDWRDLAPMGGKESYGATQIEALRRGDLAGCFGAAFSGLPLTAPTRLPGGKMELIHRVTELDPTGGRFGLGFVRAEADVQPDDWYLTCHFVDDMVMPGTLMYECSLHTLRVFLLRLGWVGEHDQVAYEPVPGVGGRLRCRGQVTCDTRVVAYEVAVKELGYGPEPYCIADALMYADGRPIVQMIDMSLRLPGLTRADVERLWDGAATALPAWPPEPPPLYDFDSIFAFARGKPSDAFGDRYRVFDEERVIARLPGPPYQFLDRVIEVDGPKWELHSGSRVVACYDVPPDAWYFAESRQSTMPFAVLLEVALQPCGWLAAYMGSALTSETDLKFRNLGGEAVLHRFVTPDEGTLRIEVHCTGVSSSGGMIIQNFTFAVRGERGPVYEGTTYFGFFSQAALDDQKGLRDAALLDLPSTGSYPLPDAAPLPADRWRMVRDVDVLLPDGGPDGLGYVRGSTPVDPSRWFFEAHFHQDPVWPGSLGLESMLQLLAEYARERWSGGAGDDIQAVVPGTKHAWTYRGQIVPGCEKVTVEARITGRDDAGKQLTADGLLAVDGRIIYEMRGFSLRMSAPLS